MRNIWFYQLQNIIGCFPNNVGIGHGGQLGVGLVGCQDNFSTWRVREAYINETT